MTRPTVHVVDAATIFDVDTDHKAAELVAPDGTRSMWIIERDAEAGSLRFANKDVAPHEQTGRLPAEWLRRVGLRCPATKTNGEQCRRTVRTFGQLCSSHAALLSEVDA